MNIVTIAVFIVLFEILLPSGKTRKFVSLITGFILIIAIIRPFLNILGSEVKFEDFQIGNSNFLDRKEIEANSRMLGEEQMKQVIELYRKKVIGQLEQTSKEVEGVYAAKADLIINEDYTSDNFGEIKRVYIILNLNEDRTETIKPIAHVEKVNIGGDNEQRETVRKLDDKIKRDIEDRINRLFNVNKENIIISLKED